MLKIQFALVALVMMAGVGSLKADDNDKAAKPEAIDFRKLKELMPEELNGLKRSSCNGERTKAGDFSISHVSATFKSGDAEKAPQVEVQVMDYGSADVAAGFAAFTNLEIDNESDSGFQKSIKVDGNPGLENWTKASQQAEITLLVGKRYLLTVKTSNIAADQVMKYVEALPLKKLAELK